MIFVFVHCQVDIYAGSLFLYEAVGWNVYISAAVILVITAIYTLLGKNISCKALLPSWRWTGQKDSALHLCDYLPTSGIPQEYHQMIKN
jgi:hypothetical protein